MLDLRRATFIDSAVLKELLRARAELAAHDARLVLVGVPPPIRRLLDLTRTSELFDDAPDVGVRPSAERAARRLGLLSGRFAPEHSHENAACSMSLPAEAASTEVTVRPVAGAWSRSATSPSAVQAPVQRVQVSSSPTA